MLIESRTTSFESTPPPLFFSSSLNLDVGTKPPQGTTSSSGQKLTTWGDWIVDTAGLDKTKWKVNGTGIEPIYEANNNPAQSKGCGAVITITATTANAPANITFDPDVLDKGNGANNSLCKKGLNLDSNGRESLLRGVDSNKSIFRF